MRYRQLVLHGLATLFALAPLVALAGDISLDTPGRDITVAPGGYVDVPLVFVNNGSAISEELRLVITSFQDGYDVEQRSQPDCGDVQPSSFYDPWREFTVAPIPAGAQRTCVVRITRSATAIDNAFADWFIDGTDVWIYFNFGIFADIGIAGAPVSSSVGADGIVQTVFRLSASNGGEVDAQDVIIGLGPTCYATNVTVDLDFPGACEPSAIGCGFTGGDAPAARMPLIAAGETQSCLVRMSAPREDHASVQVYLSGAFHDAATGGWIGDTNDSNDTTTFDIDAIVGGQAPPNAAPTLSLWMLGVLALLLIAAGRAAGRTRRR